MQCGFSDFKDSQNKYNDSTLVINDIQFYFHIAVHNFILLLAMVGIYSMA